MSLYPVNLDIRDLLCVIIGGGTVASRKIESLLPCGAQIRVVSPMVIEQIAERAQAGLLDWQQKEYEQDDLSGAKLVFAATDNSIIQKQIVADADAAGILINVIDMPESCSFQVPASFRRGGLLLTVATGGGSPALAARIRKELETSYGPEYGILVALMAAVRKEIVASSDDPAEHKQMFDKILDSDILDCIQQEKWGKLGTLMQNILPARIDALSLVRGMQNTKKEQIV
jgi:precorrin-2 dehydrogenase/sirohydrochlorin ferrochelatase